MKEYAYYKGEELIDIGTAEELSKRLNTSAKTIRWYAGSNRWKNKKNGRKNRIAVVAIEKDED